MCEVCQKTFKRKDYLKQHLKIHAPERDMCRCPREGCGRTYTTVFNLQSHILAFHEEWRPFLCEQGGCGKTFATRVSPPAPHPGAGSQWGPGGPRAFPCPGLPALSRCLHLHGSQGQPVPGPAAPAPPGTCRKCRSPHPTLHPLSQTRGAGAGRV